MRNNEAIDTLARLGPVIAVTQFDTVDEAVSVSRALWEGGVRAVEVTLRTPVALKAIEAVAGLFYDQWVGAGTVVRPGQFQEVAQAGARFAVSPGFTLSLAEAAQEQGLPYLPGVMTPTEILQAQSAGFTRLKFFPAEAIGGPRALRALAGPFPDVRFCPTGGITPEGVPGYLALPNVMCVGGSWLTPRELIQARDWKAITALARVASELKRA